MAWVSEGGNYSRLSGRTNTTKLTVHVVRLAEQPLLERHGFAFRYSVPNGCGHCFPTLQGRAAALPCRVQRDATEHRAPAVSRFQYINM